MPLENEHLPGEPLATRHVFLDTQVYRALGHNPANPALVLLKEQIEARRVVLHTTDLTLLEIKRQFRDMVLETQEDLNRIERTLQHWRQQAPRSTPKASLEFDAEALSRELFYQFSRFVEGE